MRDESEKKNQLRNYNEKNDDKIKKKTKKNQV